VIKNDGVIAGAKPAFGRSGGNGGSGISVGGNGLSGVDSLPVFTGSFTAAGVDPAGNPQSVWPFTMVGHSPRSQEPALIGAPLIPVSIDVRNDDGTPFMLNGKHLVYDATQFVTPVLESPIFSPVEFATSIFPTQFTDAMMRASMWRGAGDGDFDRGDHVSELWHTVLFPLLQKPRTIQLKISDVGPVPNDDGTCCKAMFVSVFAFVNALYPAGPDDTASLIGSAIHDGDMTQKQLTTFLFPNTFLFDPRNDDCCILGFHDDLAVPGDARNGNREKRYVFNYSSWVSPGLFRNSQDVSVLSHELAETFNDPFGDNRVPWWSVLGQCQDFLETGDVIEGLADSSKVLYPVSGFNGFAYHLQNEALMQWFSGASPSRAWHGAYSFPDTTTLTAPALSLPLACGQGSGTPSR
jgi:hypothetical protein